LSTWYAVHRGERYQDLLVIGIVSIGALASLLSHLDVMDVFLGVVPWCGIAAMVLSTYGTWVTSEKPDVYKTSA
jgi:hypothetical protein